MKKLLTTLAAAIGLAAGAFAATINLSTVTANTTLNDGDVVIGTLAGNYKVSIADGATVTLRDVTINGVGDSDYLWAGITCEGDATIILEGANTVKGFYENYPGIHVPANKTLTIKGDGSLDASSNGLAAGIGAGYRIDCGSIVIEVGTITATGGNYAAGIGGAWYAQCGDITITGGTITATGGLIAAGIGGGRSGRCGSITVEGGTITATGGSNSSGIGGAWNADCGDITITGGSTTATGGSSAAAIGGGRDANCGDITIGAGITSVVATRVNSNTQCIGAGENGTAGSVTVDSSLNDTTSGNARTIIAAPPPAWDGNLATLNADVVIDSDMTIYGDLAGQYKVSIADGVTVTLRDVTIDPADSAAWAGITCEGDATIILEGESTVKGFWEDYPGIHVPENKTLTIRGSGSLHASCSGNGYGAGIGGGYNISCGNIVIEGGTIIATGGKFAAGIGGGYNATCGDISIGAGIDRVEATCGSGAVPIGAGGGSNASCGTVTIDPSLADDNDTPTRTITPPAWAGNLATLTGNVTIESDMTLYGDLAGLYKVSIANGVTVTLANAIITNGAAVAQDNAYSWAGLTCLGDATIVLAAGSANVVNGFYDSYPGIYVPENKTLTISGSGALSASGSVGSYDVRWAPGIGGGYQIDSGNIVIEGGTINAIGGNSAAAIGGAYESACGDITITGGDITATGASYGTGIGGGNASKNKTSSCGTITIGAGIVQVVATKGTYGGEPIGAGANGGTCAGVVVDSGLYDDHGDPTRTIVSTPPLVQSETIDGVTWYYRTFGEMTEIYNDGNPAVSPEPSGALEIPATLGGRTVTALGDFALVMNGGLTSVIIPAGVKSIGQKAFYGCSSLASVTIPNGVESIGNRAFGYSGLETAYVGRGRTDAIKEMLLAGDHDSAFVNAITFVEPVWDGNLATLDYDVVIDRDMAIYGELAGQYKVSIADGVTVTLNNAVITNGLDDSSYSWAGLTCLGDATIVLANGSANFVKGFYENYPGIFVPAGSTLTISGSGSLEASSNGWGAGIGGGDEISCGNIVIAGGTVVATGGQQAAGIGSGCKAACGDIAISSGTMVATSAFEGPGIGAGSSGSCGDISITGGDVTATGGNYAAGIGAGSSGSCGDISITGGDVTATGGNYAAGIGTADYTSQCGDISILGGRVTATGGNRGAGIGSGDDSSACGDITIGADIECVAATCGSGAVPIGAGGGSDASCGTVTVDPSLYDDNGTPTRTITPTATPPIVWDGNLATLNANVVIDSDMTIYGELAGQYKVSIADGVTVTLSDAIITNGQNNSSYSWAGLTCLGDAEIVLANGSANFVKGFYKNYPGIFVPAGSTLTISGTGSLDASSNGYGAGIGGGYEISCGSIVIAGGTVNASGGRYAAGIGSGCKAACGDIAISSGTMVATSATEGPGIGAGSRGNCGDISIAGGRVTATGGNYAAGIGTGDYTSQCGDISITGGRVTATGGSKGAGIGSGDDSSACGDITIGADIERVEATCGSSAEPIGMGGGRDASCGAVSVDPSLDDDDGSPTRIITGSGSASGYAAWATVKELAGADAAWDAKPAKWNGWANAFIYTYGEGLADGTKPLMTISFDSNGKPIVTTAPVVEGHIDFTPVIIGTSALDDWTSPVILIQSGNTWSLPSGQSANFFRVRLAE